MNEVFNTILNTYLIPALATFISGFITWLGAKIKSKYDEKCNNELINNTVKMAVEYAEQKYKDLKGSEKYEKAVGKAISVLNSKNINVSSDELDMLVESAVLSLTNVIKEQKDYEQEK